MIDPQTESLRHSAAHVLAMAAIRLFPGTKLGIGPVTESGFHYDFEFPRQVTWEDVVRIEQEMNLIIQEDLPFTPTMAAKEQAFDILLRRGQIYKAELLRELEDAQVSFYKTGEEFIDLCRGPHIQSTSQIGAVKLTSLSGAYWKGDPSRPQLQRVTGIAFKSFDQMRDYLAQQEAISQRDFRKLAKELHLTLGGSRGVTYTPEGAIAIELIAAPIVGKLAEADYQELMSPPVRGMEYLFSGIDAYYSHKNRSYKELPIRVFERNRHELANPLRIAEKELSSVNTLISKDFFRKEDLLKELVREVNSTVAIVNDLDIRYSARITAPNFEDTALQRVTEMLQRAGISQTHLINPGISEIIVDFIGKDSLSREWIMTSIRIGTSDQITYVAADGEFTPAYTISVAWILDKILAFFLEDQEGVLPGWLSPVQIRIVPISEEQNRYSGIIEEQLLAAGYRVDIDTRSETMQSKIRDAELLKIPAILVIGEKEVNNNSVSIRLRNKHELGMVSSDGIVAMLQEHV